MKHIVLLSLIIFSVNAFSQVQDDFSDNDFSLNPTWLGDDSVFTVVDDGGNLKLRSNKLIASTNFYLATANTLVTNTQFEFNLRLAFNTSGPNFVDVYLTCNQSDLSSSTLSGYFVRIGTTTDEISLYNILNGTETEIIDGVDGITNVSNNNLKIKVICSATNDWSLERDISGTGNSYVLEGTINDNASTGSSFCGIKITQSTATFFQKHYFDNLYIGPIILDVTAPTLVSSTLVDATHVDILFSESVDQTSAENSANYSFAPSLGIASVARDLTNLSLVHITTSSALVNGTNYTLTISNVADLFSNNMTSGNLNVSLLLGEIPSKGDIVITEFFCDPSPKIGLAEIEFVEIYNKSSKIFHLQGWKLGDNATSGTIADSWILPGDYKVLVTTSAKDSFPNSIAVSSFPSLNNAGDNIVLRDTSGLQIDSLTFDDTWYQDEIKADGGYTIELINPNDPCSGKDNWKASNSASGGTPGAQNSIFDITPDTQDPSIILLTAIAPKYLSVDFSEGMDSLSLVNALATANPGLTIFDIFAASAEFPTNMLIQFNENLVASQTYNINIQNIKDCWNNIANLSGSFALPEDAIVGDLVINEILSDSKTGGADFIELKNNSKKLINLKDYELANFSNDTISNNKIIAINYVLNPGDYVVITPDSNSQKQLYPATISGKFIEMSLPTYSNDSGTVYLIKTYNIIDKVSYESDWQFALLDDTDGKSLEKIDSKGLSNDKNNWHTASETIGFASPGRENSQEMYGEKEGVISLTNSLFSPDNDGNEDVLQINYSMINSGKLATLTVYDDRGRKVKDITKSELIGTEGTFTWDGVTETNQKASIGTYVLVFEAFDLAGNTFINKLAFVLAGKL